LDKNKDGKLSKEEMKGAYTFFEDKSYMLEDEVEKIFKIADTNENGYIDYSEFIASASQVS
jgi:Ca2+-binding EF-hand superfamily protein